MSKQRPFAVFDIDGTVMRWQLYHAIADELARKGFLDSAAFEKVRAARMNWKKRAAHDAFHHYEEALVGVIDQAISGVSESDYQKASIAVMDEYADQVYTYTRDLILALKAKGYLLFAISASQAEIVKLFAEHYGFDDAGGSQYEAKDGYYTGRKLLLLKRDRKPELLNQLVAKHDATWQGSIAVGDSESDIPMLATVEQPIAFNPTKELFEHARGAGWKVVVERKNMIYELESDDGSYLLAKTNAG